MNIMSFAGKKCRVRSILLTVFYLFVFFYLIGMPGCINVYAAGTADGVHGFWELGGNAYIFLAIAVLLAAALVYFVIDNIKLKRLNKSLSEKESVLDDLIDTTIFKFTDGKMEVLYYSKGIPGLSGRTKEEYEEWWRSCAPLEETVYHVDVPRFSAQFNKLISGETDKIDFTYRLKKLGGELAWINLYAVKISEDNGVPVYAGLYSGITEDAKMYRKVVDDSATGFFVVDNTTKNILYVNNAIYDMGLANNSEIMGHKCYKAIYDKDECCEFCCFKNMSYNSYVTYEYLDEAAHKHFTHRARLMDWHGIPSHIVYVIDDSEIYFANRELELSRKMLNEAVRHSGMGYWEYYPQYNRAVWTSPDHNKVSGSEPYLDNFPESWFDMGITAPESVDTLRGFYSSAKEGAAEGSCEIKSIVDGRTIWERLRFTAMKDDDGKLIKVIITALDITKEVKVRQRFQEEQARRSALETDSIATIVYNVSDDIVLEGTGHNMELGECTLEEYLDKVIVSRVWDTYIERLKSEFSRQGMMKQYDNGNMIYSVHFVIDCDSGHACCCSADINMTKEPNTDDIYAFIYIRDITEKYIRDIAMQSVVERETDFISYLDVQTGMVNRVRYKDGVSALPGKEPRKYKESILESIPLHIPPEEQDYCRSAFELENIMEELKNNDEYSIIYSIYTDESKTQTRRVKMCVYYLSERQPILVFARYDITDIYNLEQKKNKRLKEALKEAERANAAKSEFMSRISHEIRTPMNAVLGIAAIGAQELEDEKAVEYFNKISSSGKYLLGLINDILDMAKIESQRIQLNPGVVNIRKFINDIDVIIKPLYEARKITMKADMSGVKYKYAYFDPMRVQQILINLLGNAIKFSDPGGIIECSAVCTEEGGSKHIVFKVRDYGIGMSEEFLERLFIPFEQELNKYSGVQAGTGLGLAISKNLAELMQGTISVVSKPGEGSTFTVDLPFIEPSQKKIMEYKRTRSEDNNLKVLVGKNILLAEDHPINTEIVMQLFGTRGANVEHAEDGCTAVKMFSESRPYYYDLVLMDIMMPNMDGTEAARQIRALSRSDAGTVPIIAMSANTYDSDIKIAEEAGMNGHISKPIDVKNMFDTIKKYI